MFVINKEYVTFFKKKIDQIFLPLTLENVDQNKILQFLMELLQEIGTIYNQKLMEKAENNIPKFFLD